MNILLVEKAGGPASEIDAHQKIQKTFLPSQLSTVEAHSTTRCVNVRHRRLLVPGYLGIQLCLVGKTPNAEKEQHV